MIDSLEEVMDVMEKGNNSLKKESTGYGTCH